MSSKKRIVAFILAIFMFFTVIISDYEKTYAIGTAVFGIGIATACIYALENWDLYQDWYEADWKDNKCVQTIRSGLNEMLNMAGFKANSGFVSDYLHACADNWGNEGADLRVEGEFGNSIIPIINEEQQDFYVFKHKK